MRISIILAALLVWAGNAEAQSVKCNNPQTVGQRLVCEDRVLRGLDQRNNGDYLNLRAFADPPDYFRLKRSQGPYLRARDSCRSRACVHDVLRRRSYDLQATLRGY